MTDMFVFIFGLVVGGFFIFLFSLFLRARREDFELEVRRITSRLLERRLDLFEEEIESKYNLRGKK